ncbi:uncharacterized protein LOC116268003 [Nymphaea colorata]|uniref:uncharacterized protein LOC116268003 n=1 Tax=Nymphaea colorata TaxID=210225 RepID=UPI00129EFDE3|nr:uncharacterized protein LOC116268003 [Nymphaea colorata]
MDVEEEITGIHWLRNQGKYMKMFTSNSKSIKFWKIFEKAEKKVVKSAGKELNMPKLQNVESNLTSTLLKTFPNKHLSNINSISVSSNEEYVLSSDDVHAYLWGLEDADRPFVAVDLLGNEKIEDIKENITFSKMHPTTDSLFMFGTNKGTLKMCDLRVSVSSDNNAINFKN